MTNRDCPAPDCYAGVPLDKIACPRHARLIHPDTRARLARALRNGDVDGHQIAMRDAIEDMTPKRKRAER